MAQDNKKLIICINNLTKGGSEKQVSYISNFFSKYYKVKIFLLEKKKIEYKINNKIEIIQSNYSFLVLLQFLFELINNKFNFILFFLPKSYLIFGILSILVSKKKKILFRRSLNYYQKKHNILKKIEVFLHNFTGYFITNSFAARNELINFERVKIKNTSVVYNYIKDITILKNKYKPKTVNFLCTANFHKYKNHNLILDTLFYFNQYEKNWKIYLLGNNKNLNKADIISAAKALKISKNIIFIKKLSKKFSFPYIKIGFLFSKYESLPNAIIEYTQRRIPTIAYDTGDIKKILNNCGIVFKKNNPEIIAKKILKTLNSNLLRTYSINTQSKMELFSKEKTLLKLLLIFKNLEN